MNARTRAISTTFGLVGGAVGKAAGKGIARGIQSVSKTAKRASKAKAPKNKRAKPKRSAGKSKAPKVSPRRAAGKRGDKPYEYSRTAWGVTYAYSQMGGQVGSSGAAYIYNKKRRR